MGPSQRQLVSCSIFEYCFAIATSAILPASKLTFHSSLCVSVREERKSVNLRVVKSCTRISSGNNSYMVCGCKGKSNILHFQNFLWSIILADEKVIKTSHPTFPEGRKLLEKSRVTCTRETYLQLRPSLSFMSIPVVLVVPPASGR